MYKLIIEAVVSSDDREHAIEHGQKLLEEMMDGTDFMGVLVVDAVPLQGDCAVCDALLGKDNKCPHGC